MEVFFLKNKLNFNKSISFLAFLLFGFGMFLISDFVSDSISSDIPYLIAPILFFILSFFLRKQELLFYPSFYAGLGLTLVALGFYINIWLCVIYGILVFFGMFLETERVDEDPLYSMVSALSLLFFFVYINSHFTHLMGSLNPSVDFSYVYSLSEVVSFKESWAILVLLFCSFLLVYFFTWSKHNRIAQFFVTLGVYASTFTFQSLGLGISIFGFILVLIYIVFYVVCHLIERKGATFSITFLGLIAGNTFSDTFDSYLLNGIFLFIYTIIIIAISVLLCGKLSLRLSFDVAVLINFFMTFHYIFYSLSSDVSLMLSDYCGIISTIAFLVYGTFIYFFEVKATSHRSSWLSKFIILIVLKFIFFDLYMLGVAISLVYLGIVSIVLGAFLLIFFLIKNNAFEKENTNH